MNEKYPFVNPPLPYEYDGLEPYIDAETMRLHHNRHLQTYVDKLNDILSKYPQYQSLSLEQLLISADSIPPEIRSGIRNNAGGVYNHIFYFMNLRNPGSERPPFPLHSYLDTAFHDFGTFQQKFTDAALSVFGSGYAWLVIDALGDPQIITTANQDTPLTMCMFPLLNIDVWEHAYYLKHFNRRADYIKDWFAVINWTRVNQIYLTALKHVRAQLLTGKRA